MLSELLPEVKRKLHELVQQHLLQEKNSAQNSVQQHNTETTDIYMKLDAMNFRLDELDKLVLREPKAKRDDYRRFITLILTKYVMNFLLKFYILCYYIV